MNSLIYIKSLHRPYNQNLNTVKWVCNFSGSKNLNGEISKSDFYIDFYVFLIKRLYNLYRKNPDEYLTHGIPSFESVKKSYNGIIGISKSKKRTNK